MVFNYLHPDKKKGEQLYNFQLVVWLIKTGYIPRDKKTKILDIASGRGHFYFALKKLGYTNVTAQDLDPQFDECEKGDIVKGLKYKDNSFDLIISRDVAEHIRESDRFFVEQHRILKKGGACIVMTPNAEKMTLGEFYADYTHVMPWTRKSLYEAYKMHGFDKIKISRLRAIPLLWKYTENAFNYLYSRRYNNLLGIGKKN